MTVQGAWRMVEFELWDLDTIEFMGPAIIEFGESGDGPFRELRRASRAHLSSFASCGARPRG